MRKYLFGLLLLIYAGTLTASQDSSFIAARKAFQAGNAHLLASHAKNLQSHLFAPYIEFYQLRLKLRIADFITIKAFLSRYENQLIANRLREEWLKILGEDQQWDVFATEYPLLVNGNIELQCYSMQQRLAANDHTALTDAHPIWFNAYSMPDSCTPVFDALISHNKISVEDIWTRIRLALEAGQTSVARYINRHLLSNEALNISHLNPAAQNPLAYLKRQKNTTKSRAEREIILFALLRLLRNDTDQAYAHWSKVKDSLSESDQSYFLGRLGHRAALRHDPRALDWFIQANNTKTPYPLTETLRAWQTRSALRAQNWDMVLKSIANMPHTEQRDTTWRYWKARALKEKGDLLGANNILIPLSTKLDFYGQLAKEELGDTISLPNQVNQISEAAVQAMQQQPGIQRTLAFYRLNIRIDGFREWVWALRDFNDLQLLTAAEVARRHGLFDRAINAANRTVLHHDFNLRFLAPYRDELQDVLQQQELDEAWVFGLIRQESRFVTDIRSSAGATGLMQLMPDTAKWVASQLGLRNFQQRLVSDVNTNLRLGTYYLKHVLDTLDNQPLLASAAYNAGPGRARRWRDDTNPLEGAIYAETIPFNETRDYVKKVLKNAMYYAKVLEHDHNAPTLKQRLGVVNSK
jgi:peptidoglycan lytic transglycosylase